MIDSNFYDSLVLIHPDFGVPHNRNYFENIQIAVAQFRRSKKSIFILENPLDSKNSNLTNFLKDFPRIPNNDDFPQYEVDYIAGRLHKLPRDINIAFGGTLAGHCVYGVARTWCAVIVSSFQNNYSISPVSCPISFGRIFNEIV